MPKNKTLKIPTTYIRSIEIFSILILNTEKDFYIDLIFDK